MTTPLSQFPKPEAEQYKGRRKLFLVPNYVFPPEVPAEGQELLDRYWSEVRDHVNNLERSLGSVAHVYHESLFSDGDEGLDLLRGMNPRAAPFIQAICQSSAKLEATEDRDLVMESSDWQRSLSIGLTSQKVVNTAMEGYQEATRKRFEHIGACIDETLKEDETGALFISEDHRVQFPADVQVFYVAPPALDALKRWINDQMQAAARSVQQAAEPSEPETEPSQPEVEGEPDPAAQTAADDSQPAAPDPST